LPVLLDRLEEADGAAEPVPSADGWELVLAENVAYLVDDERRWRALGNLRRTVGLAPEQILAVPEAVLREVVAGARPAERAERLRRCAELAIAGAPWSAYPGIGHPGADRIDLFTGARAVLALDANGLRVLTRLGSAARLAPTPPATGRPRPPRALSCQPRRRRCSVPISCSGGTAR
jgi:hypothetical protein